MTNPMNAFFNPANAFKTKNFGSDIAQANQTGLQTFNTVTPNTEIGIVGGERTYYSPDGALQGAIAIPAPLAPVVRIPLQIDTTGIQTAQNILLFDTHDYNSAACSCAGSNLINNVVKVNGTCDKYASFKQELCSKVYVLTAMRLQVVSGSNAALTSTIKIYRSNLLSSNQVDNIDPALQISEFQQRNDIITLPLQGVSARLDNYTAWVIDSFPGNTVMNITLFVGALG